MRDLSRPIGPAKRPRIDELPAIQTKLGFGTSIEKCFAVVRKICWKRAEALEREKATIWFLLFSRF